MYDYFNFTILLNIYILMMNIYDFINLWAAC